MSKVKPLSYLADIKPYLPGDFAVDGVEEIVNALLGGVETFTQGAQQTDDRTVLAMEVL